MPDALPPSVYETLFSWIGILAMLGWLSIILAPRVRWLVTIVARLVIPGLIALAYGWLLFFQGGPPAEGAGFSSLAGVRLLFLQDSALLAGWIHYLAFDLFVGTWEVEDAQRNGVHHLLVLPCLFATFMYGPLGLLLYVMLRSTVLGLRKMRAARAAASADAAEAAA